MRKLLIVFIPVLAAFLIEFSYAYADDCNMGRNPDGVYPVNDTDISMLDEDINVNVKKGFVTCIFKFRNDGEARDVLMGFPRTPDVSDFNNYPEKEKADIEKRASINNFKAFDKDTPIPVKIEQNVNSVNPSEPGIRYKDWFIFKVRFDKNETKTVKNTYSLDYSIYSNGDVLVGYILRTGAFWKDAIGHAKVTFEFGDTRPYEILSVKPDGFSYAEGNKIVWEASNFEPTEDLSILFNPFRYNELLKQLEEGQYKEDLKKDKAEKEKSLNDLKTMDSKALRERLKATHRHEEDGIALYITSLLLQRGETLSSDSDRQSESIRVEDITEKAIPTEEPTNIQEKGEPVKNSTAKEPVIKETGKAVNYFVISIIGLIVLIGVILVILILKNRKVQL